jgi:hypothetical protein
MKLHRDTGKVPNFLPLRWQPNPMAPSSAPREARSMQHLAPILPGLSLASVPPVVPDRAVAGPVTAFVGLGS